MPERLTIIPDLWKYLGGGILSILSFLPLAMFRLNSNKTDIEAIRIDLERVRSEKTKSDDLVSAMAILTKSISSLVESNIKSNDVLGQLSISVSKQTDSNIKVHETLIKIRTMYERVEILENKSLLNENAHGEIKSWVMNFLCRKKHSNY